MRRVFDLRKVFTHLFLLSVTALLVTTMQTTQSFANAQQCSYLSRQLNALGGSSNYKRYDDAAEKQSTQIWYIKRDIRRAGCRNSNAGNCRALNNTLRKMNANYRKLINLRNQYRGGSSSQRRAIQARMAALRCNGASSSRQTLTINRNSGFSAPTLGGYRTMCVRTCDGYYFPVSHTSQRSDFERDQRICNALCPASESRLYVHQNSGQESEDMVSVEGEAYTALPTAFKYREQGRSASCSCGAANLSAAGLKKDVDALTTKPVEPEDPFLKSLPTPVFRPDLFADTETQAHATSGLDADYISKLMKKRNNQESLVAGENRVIRVVGPEFLPDPEEAIDLRSPGPIRVQ